MSLCPGRSDVNLFRYREGIIDLDAQVSDSAFDLRVNPAAAGRLLGFREVFTGLFRGDFQIVIDRLRVCSVSPNMTGWLVFL